MLEALGIELARRDRGLDRAPGLDSVRAVGELALRGQRLDVLERAAQSLRRRPIARPRAVPACRRGHRRRAASTSSRAVVVWRPRWSPSRTAPVSCTSAPTSWFTSVDLPTPDAPMSATVRLPCAIARNRSRPSPVSALGHDDLDAHRRTADVVASLLDRGLVDGVGLGQHDDRRRATLEGEHQLALEPPRIRPVGQRLHDQHDVDVGRDDLGRRATPSIESPRTNAERRGSTATTSSSSTSTQSPVAARSSPWAARTVPSAVRTVARPMSTRTTRPAVAARAHGVGRGLPLGIPAVVAQRAIVTRRHHAPAYARRVRTAIALFTRDLRVRDNPVLAGAQQAAERVIPLVRARRLRALDRARAARIVSVSSATRCAISMRRSGRAAARSSFGAAGGTKRSRASPREFDATSVHVARDVSGYARARVGRLRKARRVRGRRTRRHHRSCRPTRSESPSSCSRRISSDGSTRRGVTTRRRPAGSHCRPVSTSERSPATRARGLGGGRSAADSRASRRGRGSALRVLRRRSTTRPAPTRRRGSRRICTSGACRASDSRAAAVGARRCRRLRAPTLLARLLRAVAVVATRGRATTTCAPGARRSGATRPAMSRRGRPGAPASRSSTPACASCAPKDGCTTGCAWSSRRS